ncbi:unnamed protein product [marine sediment metagenome]|uniref:Uncharacterized protein n=1 Tax=marine sediment metagenome TaxID=412755 RepID=X1RWJ4_9ZZZZ
MLILNGYSKELNLNRIKKAGILQLENNMMLKRLLNNLYGSPKILDAYPRVARGNKSVILGAEGDDKN